MSGSATEPRSLRRVAKGKAGIARHMVYAEVLAGHGLLDGWYGDDG